MNTQTLPFEVMCRTPWGKIVWKTFDAIINWQLFTPTTSAARVSCKIEMPQLFNCDCLPTEDFYEQLAFNVNAELPPGLFTTPKNIEVRHTKEFV